MTALALFRTPRHGSAGLRRIGVLLVLTGVLAMHALGGGSHMAMSGGPMAGAQTTGAPMAGAPMAGAQAHGQAADPPPTATAPVWVIPAAVPESGLQTACLAVLLSLVLLVALAASTSARLLPALTANNAGHSTAPLGRGPPRQLLAQLCVLRT